MFLSQRFLRNSEAPLDGGSNEIVKTDEQKEIDKRNLLRANQGLEPLPYPNTPSPAAASVSTIDQFRESKTKELTENNTAGLSAEEITEEAEKLVRAEADRLKLEQEAKEEEARKANGTHTIKISAKPAVAAKVEIPAIPNAEEDAEEEEKMLKFLSKKMGKEIKSLDELNAPTAPLSKEDKEKAAQERENNKLAYALQNKKISQEEIKSFIEDTKNLDGVAYGFFAANQLDLDPTLSDKEIRENFELAYSLNEDTDSINYKLGQRQIEFTANNIIAKKHAKYLGLENDYSAYETLQTEKTEYQKDILAKAPLYKRDVEAAAAKVTKLTLGGYEVELDKEVIDSYASKMISPDYAESQIKRGYSLDEIETTIRNSALVDNIETIVTSILEADRLKNRAGQRGVVPPKNVVLQNVLSEEKEEERKKLQQRLGMTAN